MRAAALRVAAVGTTGLLGLMAFRTAADAVMRWLTDCPDVNPETRTNITLGCSDRASYSLQFPGALSDLLSWAGMERPVQTITEGVRMHGLDLWEAAQHVAVGFVNKVYQGLSPYKMLIEIPLRVETFPDVTRPRPMYDRLRYTVKTVGGQPFEGIYDVVTGAPRLNPDPLKGLLAAGVDVVETRARSFGNVMSKAEAFLRKAGVREKASADFSEKAAAARQWRRALREGDPERIERTGEEMLAQYAKARVDVRRAIRAAVRATHPMARVPKRWREDFMASLTARDKVELDLAIEYWRETWPRLSLPRPRQEGRAVDRPPSRAAGGLAAGM